MANNNYAGFNYGGTQYNTGQVTYPAVTNATYANAAAYQNAAVAAGQGGGGGPGGGGGGGGYAAAGAAAGGAPGYGGYGDYRSAMQSYDATKTFYQQAPASYNTASAAAAAAAAVSKTHYSAPPVKNPNSAAKGGMGKMDKSNGAPKPPPNVAAGNSYSGYDTALYNAASMYVAQQHPGGQKPNNGGGGNNSWYQRKMGPTIPGAAALRGLRPKAPPRPQQLHYCEVCKISCAGPQTYREHLEGQKHKKREASLKMQATATNSTQNRGNNYHCELCDVTCTGTDAYAAHVRGAKHQKVVKLHQKLGKPIPSEEPKKMGKINFVPAAPAAGAAGAAPSAAASSIKSEQAEAETTPAASAAASTENMDDMDDSLENTDNIKPVGGEYIEEVKDDEGKILSFNCKLCDCKFNDPNAKEMHMKGRRHRLQYKRKVQPDLVVDFKPTPRQRRLAEARAQRALMSSHRGDDHEGSSYWDEQRNRQYTEEYDYNNWMSRSFGGAQRFGRVGGGPPPHFGMMPGVGGNVRRPESTDDRHAIARHAEIYPMEEELQTIQRIVSHTERALKLVSDALVELPNTPAAEESDAAVVKKEKTDKPSEKDGRDNQIFSFHKDADNGGNVVRILKGVMRVGFLAKGLLLHGDTAVELVVLCAEKPTTSLLQRVANLLPDKLKEVAGDTQVNYRVEVNAEEASVIVLDEVVAVKITLTSPLLREACDSASATKADEAAKTEEAADSEFLPREPCLRALADLRHAKWFQARATGLQSCVMVIRILRDLCQRVSSWQSLPQWSLELLVEKVISSAGFPISPGDCLRRIMEALSSGFLINGPGLLDPCEKDPTDALQQLSKQEREDLTVSSQLFLRYIAFRQMFKVLGMEQLPAMKFPIRPWRINRKRRRSSGKAGVSEADPADIEETGSDEKVAKKDITPAVPATA
ncbi:zinc finger RNA-binding protein [Drosophila nasuta]|uniref:Zinc finger RNA-binding protein n=1 Tax=Drosophila albomicans TaxID=7291 RepID=A0A6P8WSB6_DROAB|nr:zinc finger RNA-binding protein [Drosophila albomicans]XP_034102243.1 zinc finger RNA-binding protein [Drosophila albomicans]XP_060658755.1 zinc finger RNA-binding protein [Drosophila nasuta]XP_060658756.1 zinc finger RNA-binding protein [Drosophila nasuta]